MLMRLLLSLITAIAWVNLGTAQQNTSYDLHKAHRASVEKGVYSTQMDSYDVSYYKLDINLSNSTAAISGTVTIKAKSVVESMSTFTIQLINQLNVSSVKINGNAVTFSHSNNLITVNLTTPFIHNEIFTANITYAGTPGEGLSNTFDNNWGVWVTWTLSESFHAKDWFPAKEELTDKADSADILITVPTGQIGVSNGVLASTLDLGNGKTRFEWKSRYPIAYYLIAATVSNYHEYTGYLTLPGMSNPMPIQNFVYNVPNCLESNQAVIDQTELQIELFSELFGLYPFSNEKYGHVMAPFGGGMEHQTITTLGYFTPGLVAHELAHMWFGDYVTCGTWQDIWINEGFASYGEYLHLQHLFSQSHADNWLKTAHNYARNKPNGSVYINQAQAYDESRIFDYSLSYKKGASLVHMIRHEINNDEVFFNVLKAFLNRYAHSTATGNDFLNVLNEVTQSNYQWFFDQWYYGFGYPIYRFEYSIQGNALNIKVMHNGSSYLTTLFKTSMEVVATTQSGVETQRIFVSENEQNFNLTFSNPVKSVEFDPNNWILKQTESVTSVNEINSNIDVTILPNPASNSITITMPSNTSMFSTEIISINGVSIQSNDVKGSSTTLNIEKLQPGIYLVKVKSGNKVYTKRIVKS